MVFVLQLVSPYVGAWLAFVPGAGLEQPWRFLTAAFVHGGPMHIAFNMYCLYLFGPSLEALLGRARYVATYLICALGGSVAYQLLNSPESPAWWAGTVGASGAVFGLFGAFVVLMRKLGRDATQVYVLIGINLVISFVFASSIAWEAHLGGLATGAACAAVIAFLGRRPELGSTRGSWGVHWVGLGVITAVLIGAALARYAAAGML